MSADRSTRGQAVVKYRVLPDFPGVALVTRKDGRSWADEGVVDDARMEFTEGALEGCWTVYHSQGPELLLLREGTDIEAFEERIANQLIDDVGEQRGG